MNIFLTWRFRKQRIKVKPFHHSEILPTVNFLAILEFEQQVNLNPKSTTA